jgi:hypothetical protein
MRIRSLNVSIESIYGPPDFHFEPPKLLNLDPYVDPDPDHAIDFDADPDPTFYPWRIRIRLPKLMRI